MTKYHAIVPDMPRFSLRLSLPPSFVPWQSILGGILAFLKFTLVYSWKVVTKKRNDVTNLIVCIALSVLHKCFRLGLYPSLVRFASCLGGKDFAQTVGLGPPMKIRGKFDMMG